MQKVNKGLRVISYGLNILYYLRGINTLLTPYVIKP